jgi:polysaccharide export outer membrane protein
MAPAPQGIDNVIYGAQTPGSGVPPQGAQNYGQQGPGRPRTYAAAPAAPLAHPAAGVAYTGTTGPTTTGSIPAGRGFISINSSSSANSAPATTGSVATARGLTTAAIGAPAPYPPPYPAPYPQPYPAAAPGGFAPPPEPAAYPGNFGPPPQPVAFQGGFGPPPQPGFAPLPERLTYTLDSGDRLRVVVFGQDGLTNSYWIDAGGQIYMPLIGAVSARGLTSDQLSARIGGMLRQGYIREPHVAVEIEAYRPFFILGEVTQPGQYPYVANMTAETAVAIAGGFGPRGFRKAVVLTRNVGGQPVRAEVPLNTPVQPGDTIQVEERWF